MPFFKVHTADGSKCSMVKADTADQVISGARKKLGLPDTTECKLVMQDRKSPLDDDVVEFASAQANMLEIILIIDEEDDDEPMDDDPADPTLERAQPRGNSTVGARRVDVDLNEIVKKLPKSLRNHLNKGTYLDSDQRLVVSNAIKDYMIEGIQETSRSTNRPLSTMISEKYPECFVLKLENEVVDNGCNALIDSVHNALQYRLARSRRNKRPRKVDSDTEELTRRRKMYSPNRNHNEYGCVAYSPDLPDGEMEELQDMKRARLVEIYKARDRKNSKGVMPLMRSTYPTQRFLLNATERNLVTILQDWPYLRGFGCLIEHSSILLGKNVSDVWIDSMANSFKEMRLFV
ncbi:hypothetical protein QAD02_008000 [Eretmocerus hayati]|uniref:Uncharacterized protein n=1 Tax=Eretmocerus hayati TaxID=131215 RepID=A0ACC2N595_9HYME|nr:hypothetical protein QAD02_008000 [Eretmocerus hayati]